MSAEALLPVLIILWSVQAAKSVLFWLYLWQLKEYHSGRFLDHFRTDKGKKVIFNLFRLIKVPVLLLAIAWPIFWLLFFIYALETIFFFAKKQVKMPVFTAKIILLITLNLIGLPLIASQFNIWFSNRTPLALLITDIILPVIVSIIVLTIQPLAIIFRWQIINRAKTKRTRFKNLKTICITGSYGKTSTKEILKIILEQRFNILATKENQNSEIGISRCILNELRPKHQIFICEMGAYDKGKIKEVAGIAQPQIGVITGINEQHLALFGSMDNLISAEGGIELARILPNGGTLIINGDNALIQKSKIKYQNENSKIKIETCSTERKADIWAENITIEKDLLSFNACNKAGEGAEFKVNLIGKHNIENVLLAAAVAKELGMTLPEIATACEKIKSNQGAMKLMKGKNSVDIIDSTYSANPNGVLSALEHLEFWTGSKIIIMPCLIELGPAAKEIHQRIGKKICEVCDLAIITSRDWFKEIKNSAISAGMKPESIIFSENRKEILEKIKEYDGPDNVVLLEGRGPIKTSDLL